MLKMTKWLVLPALTLLPILACGDDDDNHHHHECDPACTSPEVCHHGGICGNPCNAATNPTVCETYDPHGDVLYCHDHDGMCEPTGESCTASDTAECASFQICQLFIEGGTCASPCQDVGGDTFCQKIDSSFICHASAAGSSSSTPALRSAKTAAANDENVCASVALSSYGMMSREVQGARSASP